MPLIDFTNTELCFERFHDDVSSLGSSDSFDDDSDEESCSAENEDIPLYTPRRHRRNLSSPDVILPYSEPKQNARWGEEAPPPPSFSRSLTDSYIPKSSGTPPNAVMRKTKSMEEDSPILCLDRWTSLRANQKPRKSGAITIEEGGRWSSSTGLRRSSTSDNIPQVPRHSFTDLKKNARWSSRGGSSYKASMSRRSRSPRFSKGESAPDMLHQNQYQGDTTGKVNARWASTRRSSVKDNQKKSVPTRGVSRWDSCSSFKTANSASLASVDQWSTRPMIPKRRRRSGEGKNADEPDETKEEIAKEMTVESEQQDTVTTASASTTEGDEANQEETRDERSDDEESVDLEADEYEAEGLDTFHTSFHYAATPCAQCFETIPEDANEDEGLDASKLLDASKHQVPGDSMLRAPRRRMSATVFTDTSEISHSSNHGIIGRHRGSSETASERMASLQQGCRHGSNESAPEHQGLKMPYRRGSCSNSICSHSSNDASIGSGEGNLHNRRAWVDPEKTRSHPLLDEKHPLVNSPAQKIYSILSKKGQSLKPNCPAA